MNEFGKQYKDGKKKRRRMTKIRIDELSSVDRPAQEHATATIMKRAPSLVQKGVIADGFIDAVNNGAVPYEVEIYGDYVYLYFVYDGVRYNVSGGNGEYRVSGAEASYNGDTDIDTDMIGDLVVEAIGTSAANFTKVDSKPSVEPLGKVEDFIKADSGNEDDDMSGKDQGAETALQKRVNDLETTLKKSQSIIALTPELRKHYDGLDADKQDAFLELDSGAQAKEVEMAKSADPVVYTTDEGIELRKSAGETAIAMAKRLDVMANQLKKSEEEAERITFCKRADEELSNLPGTTEVRAAMLKSVEGIADEAERTAALETLTAANTAMGKLFGKRSSSVAPEVEGGDPEAKLNKMAEDHAAKQGISFHKAYAEVIKTEQGKQLFVETRG